MVRLRDHFICGLRFLAGLTGWVLLLGTLAAIVGGVADESTPDAAAAEPSHAGPAWSVAFGPGDAYLASGAITGDVLVRDLVTGSSRRLGFGPAGSVASLACAPDGRTVAIAGAGPVLWQWEFDSGEQQDIPAGGAASTRSVAYSPDGALVAVGTYAGRDSSGELLLFDRVGRRVDGLGEFAGGVNVLTFSPDGATLAACDSSGQTSLWDVATRRERARFRLSGPCPRSIAFAPDGAWLATFCDMEADVHFWDARTGEPRGTLAVPAPGAYAFALAPDGKTAAFAGADGLARLCDVASGRTLGATGQAGRPLYAVAFAHDGRRLATGGADGLVHIWDVAEQTLSAAPRPAVTFREVAPVRW